MFTSFEREYVTPTRQGASLDGTHCQDISTHSPAVDTASTLEFDLFTPSNA